MFAAKIHPSSKRQVLHRGSCRAASIVPRAVNSSKFGSAGTPEPGMSLLQDRIQQLRGKQQAEQSLRKRPTLPHNVLMMDEVELGELSAGQLPVADKAST